MFSRGARNFSLGFRGGGADSTQGAYMTGRKRLRAVGIVVVVAALASASAYAAGGSSLKIVLPANANGKNAFTYSIKGTFSKTVTPRAWVMELSQPKTRACAATEPVDWRGQSALQVSWTPAASSPFTQPEKWHGHFKHPAWLCAYMYSQMFTSLGHSGTSKLLARAQVVLP